MYLTVAVGLIARLLIDTAAIFVIISFESRFHQVIISIAFMILITVRKESMLIREQSISTVRDILSVLTASRGAIHKMLLGSATYETEENSTETEDFHKVFRVVDGIHRERYPSIAKIPDDILSLIEFYSLGAFVLFSAFK